METKARLAKIDRNSICLRTSPCLKLIKLDYWSIRQLIDTKRNISRALSLQFMV